MVLHAARTRGATDPRRGLVIEDSPVGVAGGVAAGMVVFGFAQLMPAHRLVAAGAHHIFKNMAQLAPEISAYQHVDIAASQR
ncbi:MAG: beta-phosphoglucomutase-like phosphatase (HAD superfamily) [Gammaproteobacteria bacterium]